MALSSFSALASPKLTIEVTRHSVGWGAVVCLNELLCGLRGEGISYLQPCRCGRNSGNNQEEASVLTQPQKNGLHVAACGHRPPHKAWQPSAQSLLRLNAQPTGEVFENNFLQAGGARVTKVPLTIKDHYLLMNMYTYLVSVESLQGATEPFQPDLTLRPRPSANASPQAWFGPDLDLISIWFGSEKGDCRGISLWERYSNREFV